MLFYFVYTYDMDEINKSCKIIATITVSARTGTARKHETSELLRAPDLVLGTKAGETKTAVCSFLGHKVVHCS